MDNNFLIDYTHLNEGTEIPDVFALWCGLSSLSACLGRSVFLDMGTYTIYPNLFIVLVAGSGRCRKSTAINVSEGLLSEMTNPPKMLSQRITPEALIDAIRGKGSEPSEGFVLVDELSNFLCKKTYEAGLGSLLISFYDCKRRFEYRTKGRGLEKLTNCCLGLIGASTVDWIRNAIPVDAIGGGLTSRIIFVYVDTPPPLVARTSFSPAKEVLAQGLVKFLDWVRTLGGPIVLTKEAWELHDQEYYEFSTKTPFYSIPSLKGYASRRQVHWLKTAILFAVAERSQDGNGRVRIRPEHLIRARALLVMTEQHLPKVMSLIGASDLGVVLEDVYSTIQSQRGGVEKRALAGIFLHRLSSRELESIISTLVSSGRVKRVKNTQEVWVLCSTSPLT